MIVIAKTTIVPIVHHLGVLCNDTWIYVLLLMHRIFIYHFDDLSGIINIVIWIDRGAFIIKINYFGAIDLTCCHEGNLAR